MGLKLSGSGQCGLNFLLKQILNKELYIFSHCKFEVVANILSLLILQ